ncbi:hypothetical protein AB0O01_27545 [Streptomyces sp. NPDC093252]|uniref:hypothetical protein n=1 Tax=Streptomyces sp. NPDC093252 TaxID=3154980 RepID=UPI0034418E9C
MDLGAVLIAVTGVAGTLGGVVLTQRGADRAKTRELELTRAIEEARLQRELRRTCYTELHRDARQFATALSAHLYVLRDGTRGDEETRALENAKAAHRDRWSETLMIAPDTVLAPASALNRALTQVYGQVKRLESGQPRPGETLRSAAEAQEGLWVLVRGVREAMRRDLGVAIGGDARRTVPGPPPGDPGAIADDFTEPPPGDGTADRGRTGS